LESDIDVRVIQVLLGRATVMSPLDRLTLPKEGPPA
jgi:hypothetical protein